MDISYLEKRKGMIVTLYQISLSIIYQARQPWSVLCQPIRILVVTDDCFCDTSDNDTNCTVPKSRAAVDYTLTGVEPHGPTRSV